MVFKFGQLLKAKEFMAVTVAGIMMPVITELPPKAFVLIVLMVYSISSCTSVAGISYIFVTAPTNPITVRLLPAVLK
jgi:hypothetical protein